MLSLVLQHNWRTHEVMSLRIPEVSNFKDSCILAFLTVWNPKFPNSRLPGFKILNSWMLGVVNSSVPDFCNSWIPYFSDSGIPEFPCSRIPNFMESYIPELLKFRIRKLWTFWIVDFLEFLNSWSPDILCSWIPDIMNLWISELLNIGIPEFMSSWILEVQGTRITARATRFPGVRGGQETAELQWVVLVLPCDRWHARSWFLGIRSTWIRSVCVPVDPFSS